VTATAPLNATVYQCDELRCGGCNQLFDAPPPPGVGTKKYDESVAVMIALLKYDLGEPFHRIEKLQQMMGMPVPASTQWELVLAAALELQPVWQELVRRGAAGDVLHNDDTSMRILELSPEERTALLGSGTDERTGVFTTGIVSSREGCRVALYYTGPRHAGENLKKVLDQRAAALSPPTQMCDASSMNAHGEFETILAACLAHGRRHFVDCATAFPDEVRVVLEKLRDVYRHDAHTRQEQLSAQERLAYHQQHSRPIMTELHRWLSQQLDGHLVEPSSSLGEAIRYMLKHWERLTLFLRQPGAPLDNNICERALKKAILHRKNALFYRTLRGAAVGDLFMAFCHTAELNGVSPFDYLVAVLHHIDAARECPSDWMPWNYREALSRGQGP
jgi:hypothetical protein